MLNGTGVLLLKTGTGAVLNVPGVGDEYVLLFISAVEAKADEAGEGLIDRDVEPREADPNLRDFRDVGLVVEGVGWFANEETVKCAGGSNFGCCGDIWHLFTRSSHSFASTLFLI